MDLETEEELSEWLTPAEVLCCLRKQGPRKGKAKNLFCLWLLSTCLRRTWGCLQPRQKDLHELLVQVRTAAPKQRAAVQAPAIQLPVVQASVVQPPALQVPAAQAAMVQMPVVEEGHAKQPRKGTTRARTVCRGDEWWNTDVLVRTSRQKGQRMSMATALLSGHR